MRLRKYDDTIQKITEIEMTKPLKLLQPQAEKARPGSSGPGGRPAGCFRAVSDGQVGYPTFESREEV